MQINKKEYYNLTNENLINRIHEINRESEIKINKIHYKIIELKKEYENELMEENKKICNIIFENFIKNCEKEKYFLIKFKKFECIYFSLNNIYIELIYEDNHKKKLKLYGEFDDIEEKNNKKLIKSECSYENYILKDYDIKKLLEMIYFNVEKDSFYSLIY